MAWPVRRRCWCSRFRKSPARSTGWRTLFCLASVRWSRYGRIVGGYCDTARGVRPLAHLGQSRPSNRCRCGHYRDWRDHDLLDGFCFRFSLKTLCSAAHRSFPFVQLSAAETGATIDFQHRSCDSQSVGAFDLPDLTTRGSTMSTTKGSGIIAVLLGAMFSDPTFADEMANPRHHHRHCRPPQHHVVEVVEPIAAYLSPTAIASPG